MPIYNLNSVGTVLTPISADYTLVSGDAGKTFSNTSSSNISTVPSAGIGSYNINQGSTGTISVKPCPENLFTYSEDFNNAAWGKTTCSVTATGITDPIGGTAGRTITMSGASAFMQVASAVSTAGKKYVFSIWVQGVSGSIGQKVVLGNYNNNNRQQTTAVTLTSSWQQIVLAFIPEGTTNNNVYLDYGDAFGANVANGNAVNVYGAWLYSAANKTYVTTAGSATTATYDVQGNYTTSAAQPNITVTEYSSGIFRCDYTQNVNAGSDNTFTAINGTPRRESSIVIAAFDTPNPYDSDFVCTGTNDHTVITNAISSLKATGGRVLLRAGTYILGAAITFDASWVTLEGEARGFWGKFGGPGNGSPWPSKSSQGMPGGAKLLQTASAANGIAFAQTNLINTQNRHTGCALKNLYIYAINSNGIGIYDPNATDISEITDCVVHNFATGIDISWDTPFIAGCSLQSLPGSAVIHRGVFGTIEKNIMYDIAGQAIYVTAAKGGAKIIGNTIGSCCTSTANAITLAGAGNVVTGNTITGVVTGSAIELTTSATSCVVSGNVISIDNTIGLATTANTTGNGVYLHNGAYSNTIIGNTLNQTTTGTCTGSAVLLGAGGDTTAVSNVVVGNCITGAKWNSASATTVTDNSGGSTNKISLNPGDSH